MAAKVPKLLHKMSVTAQKSWYERNKVPLPSHLTTGSVAKASKEVKPSERVKKMQTASLKAYGATKGTRMGSDDGSGEAIRDTIAPLTRDQHSKVQAAKRAAKPKEVLDTKSKRLAFLKKLSTKPAVKAPEPEDFDHEGHDDNIDVHRQLHVSGAGSKYSMDESTMNETTKKEAEKILGGEVKEKPKMGPGKQPAGYRYVRGLARKAMKAGIKKEEVEVTEAVKDAADVGEYDYEGDMAKSQLRSILANAKRLHDMLEDQTNLPEWVQSKITLAEDYILTAANYMEGEMNEEVEHVDEKINLVKTKMGDVIKDFQKSDAPQFKGKSQEKRREMAVAAKLGAEREAGVREETEQVEEKYMGFAAVKKAVAAKGGARDPGAVAAAIGRKKYGKEKFQAMAAAGKKANEEVESVDEAKESHVEVIDNAFNRENYKNLIGKKYPKSKAPSYVRVKEVTKGASKKTNEETEVVTEAEAEGKVAVTPKEKDLAVHHGDPKKITYGDVIKARLKSVAAKKLGK